MRDRQYPLYHEELEHDSCGVTRRERQGTAWVS